MTTASLNLGSPWIEHSTDAMPVPPGTRVDVLLGNGREYFGMRAGNMIDLYAASHHWTRKTITGDLFITHYRISEVC